MFIMMHSGDPADTTLALKKACRHLPVMATGGTCRRSIMERSASKAQPCCAQSLSMEVPVPHSWQSSRAASGQAHRRPRRWQAQPQPQARATSSEAAAAAISGGQMCWLLHLATVNSAVQYTAMKVNARVTLKSSAQPAPWAGRTDARLSRGCQEKKAPHRCMAVPLN